MKEKSNKDSFTQERACLFLYINNLIDTHSYHTGGPHVLRKKLTEIVISCLIHFVCVCVCVFIPKTNFFPSFQRKKKEKQRSLETLV